MFSRLKKLARLALAGFKCIALRNLYPKGETNLNLPAIISFGQIQKLLTLNG
jgi:hypothetical protein